MTRADNRLPGRRRFHTISSKREREIKLAVDDDFRLPSLPGRTIARRLLTSTYYDTSQYDLAHAAITLRHRAERGTQTWQLKIPLLKDRQEIEVADHRSSPPPAFRDLLFLHLRQRRLAPVATLKVWRMGVRARIDHAPVADVTLDRVTVVKHGVALQRFQELEIEQVNGNDRALAGLERLLRRAGCGDHDGRPKLFRALSLPAPRPASPPAPDAPVVDHVKHALRRHVRWLLAHDPGTRLGREPESLHQMRVATRQLRSILRAASPLLVPEWADSLQDELDRLGTLLGPVRDLDVQLAYFREESSSLDVGDRRAMAQFITHLTNRRDDARGILLIELKSARYLDLIRRLQDAKDDPRIVETSVTVRDIAKVAYKKLRKAIQRLGSSTDNAGLHEIRIKTKRARYAAELAEPSVGKPATRFIRQASRLQDILGLHQDALQAEAHVRAFLAQSSSLRAAFVAGRIVERQRERRKKAETDMRACWKQLVKRGDTAWE